MLVYTSITKSYLPKARVLAQSVKRFHPNWTFVLLYSDNIPASFNLADEPFDEILMIEELNIPSCKSWAFGHQLVELCTAVKGPAAKLLANRVGVDKIMYLDPDIKVFNSLVPLERLLDDYDILLTPHLLEAESTEKAICDNEISALKHGVYNLGFFAATTRNQGESFIDWWAQRLLGFCKDDIPNGLFTDQRWCDLAPAFFSKLHIVRDPGYNVATWNISHRMLSHSIEFGYMAKQHPLRFYHFTGYDSGDGFGMLKRYASNQKLALQLWSDYEREIIESGQNDKTYRNWKFSCFENGEPIPQEARKLYRSRKDLQTNFPDPYSVVEPCFYSWWNNEVVSGRATKRKPTRAGVLINRVINKIMR